MWILIVAIIVIAAVFFLRKGKGGGQTETPAASGQAPASGAPAEKPLSDKKLKRTLKSIDEALSQSWYDPTFVYALQELARLTGRGEGVERDTELACRLWEEAVDVALLVKIGSWKNVRLDSVFWTDDEQYHSFDTDEMVHFFLDGKYVPRDPERAMRLVDKFIDAGDTKAVYLRQEVLRQLLPADAAVEDEFPREGYAEHFPKYEAELERLQRDRLLDRAAFQAARGEAVEKLEKEMAGAGFDGQSAEGLPWLLKRIGWPVPGKAPDAPSQAVAELIAFEEKEGKMDYITGDYRTLAEEGDPEAMRRLGNILRDVKSPYPGSAKEREGTAWLQKAADTGNVLARYALDPRGTDAAAMAALARTGNIEALYDLGHMVERGLGGPVSWAGAVVIWDMAWNIIGDCLARNDDWGRVWKYWLARAKGDIRDETALFWCAGEVDRSGGSPKLTVAGRYAPASAIAQRTRLAEKTDGGYKWFGKKASDEGYIKAQLLCRMEEQRDIVWSGYVKAYAEEDKERVAREKKALAIALSMPGLPDLELVRHGIVPKAAKRLAERAEQEAAQAAQRAPASAPQQPQGAEDCLVRDIPNRITDELGRTWEYVGVLGDAVRYRLIDSEQRYPGVDSLDYVVDDHTEVWLAQRHIHGNTARTFSHTFRW